MPGRADFSLELQLEFTRSKSVAADVVEAIDAVLSYMRSGSGRKRRGGAELLRLLKIARLRASEENEWHVVRLLQDALDYSSGRILRPDFDETFRLFQDGEKRSGHNLEFVSSAVKLAVKFCVEEGRKFLTDHGLSASAATAEQLLGHFEEFGRDAEEMQAFADRPGRYQIVRGSKEHAVWLGRVLQNRIDVQSSESPADNITESSALVSALVSDVDFRTILRAAELKVQERGLAEVRNLVDDPNTSEYQLQQSLERQLWIFGGRYVALAARRRLVAGDEIDIPLIRTDGSLHIVELKLARGVRSLVKRHRNAWVPTAAVHDAAAQAVNYLVGLDENRAEIGERFGVDSRRISATVLIGHPLCNPEVPESAINEVLRILSSHLNRVEVLTYKELLDGAQNALSLDDDRGTQ